MNECLNNHACPETIPNRFESGGALYELCVSEIHGNVCCQRIRRINKKA